MNLPGPQQYPPFSPSAVTSQRGTSFGQPMYTYPVSLGGTSAMLQGVTTSSELPFRSPLGQPSVFPPSQTSFGHPVLPNSQANLNSGAAIHTGSPFRQSPLGQSLSSGNPVPSGIGNPAFGQPSSPYQPPFGRQSSSQKSAFGQPPLSPKTAFGLKSKNHRPPFEEPASFRDRSWFTKPILKPASSLAKSPFTKHEPSKP